MSDIEKKRDFVSGISSSPGWKKRVRKMSDNQVVAIYLKEQSKAAKKPKPKPIEESGSDGIPF